MTTRVFEAIVTVNSINSPPIKKFTVTGEDFGDATYNAIAIVSKMKQTGEVVKEINLKEIE